MSVRFVVSDNGLDVNIRDILDGSQQNLPILKLYLSRPKPMQIRENEQTQKYTSLFSTSY